MINKVTPSDIGKYKRTSSLKQPSLYKFIKADFESFEGEIPGKHKIPRYFYHFTSEDAYELMKSDGIIEKTMHKPIFGVFMVDMNNFLKYWKKSQNWKGSLTYKLLNHSLHCDDSLVCLRIPSENLNQRRLKIRSQDLLFDTNNDGIMENYHSIYGDKIKNMSKFNQKNHALEFIYPDNIPLTDAQYVGEADIFEEIQQINSKSQDIENNDEIYNLQHSWALQTLKTIFANEPESQGIEAQILNHNKLNLLG